MDSQFGETSWRMIQNNLYESQKEFYDITQQFLDAFQLLEFPSFESLKIAMKNFSEVLFFHW